MKNRSKKVFSIEPIMVSDTRTDSVEDAVVRLPLKERKLMTIGETKLGLTLVLKKEECEKLGISANTVTKEGIRQVRAKLGLEV